MKVKIKIFIIFLLCSSLSYAEIINVPADINSIQGGINLANPGDTVLVQPGIYLETINFSGKNIVVGSMTLTTGEASYISQTVIDGDRRRSVVTFAGGEDSTAVLYGLTITNGEGWTVCSAGCWSTGGGITCKNSSPTLKDLLITGNRGSAGGGIYLYKSNPTLINVTITENSANSGGGIHFGEREERGAGYPISRPKFDSVSRCNIYSNYAVSGSDFYSTTDTIYTKIIVDTFTVNSPTNFHAYPINNFTFDIMNAKIEQINSDLYVNPNGNNNNSGLSLDEPLKTISFAMIKIIADSLNPHTIHLANGEYVDDYLPISFIDYVSISGESEHGVIFRRQDNDYSYAYFCFNDVKGVFFENVTIIGGDGEATGITCQNSNPSIKNVTLNGANILLGNSNPYIKDVKISGNIEETGMSIGSSSPTLMNVEITDNGEWGISCGENSQVNLINCTVSGNTSPYSDIGGIHISSESTLNIVNSIIWDNLLYEIGINEGGAFPDVSVIITNSLIKVGDNGIHHYNEGGTVYWLEGNIDTDPMFLDPNSGDYRLREGSPCIDAGIQDTFIVYNDGQDTIFIPPMDYVGDAPDMGVYEFGDPLAIEQESIKLPKRCTLRQNYPNPFNPLTIINYELPITNYVELSIYNLIGQKVLTLVSKNQKAGYHQVQWDASGFSSGVYYYQLVAGDYRDVKKMILLR